MTAASVVSLPVPAVVGTAMSNGVLRSTLRMPRILCTGLRGRAMRAPQALAQSMELPPPKAMMQSQPWSR